MSESVDVEDLNLRPRGQEKRGIRARIISGFMDSLMGRVAQAIGGTRRARPRYHGVIREENVPYRETDKYYHRLDIYRPMGATERLPMVLYIHGGGFRVLSKDTHWLMGLAFARRGYLVLNINYRLAPKYRYPAAIEDVCAAYRWAIEHAERLGGDPDRLIVAGESAGANLTASVTVAACYERPEKWARMVYDTGIVPKAALPATGIFQVSDPHRFDRHRSRKMPFYVRDVLQDVAGCYLPLNLDGVSLDLADPLLLFERQEPPDRPLPPFYLPVGTKDILLYDTRRMANALTEMGVPCKVSYFPGEMHAFHAMVWRPAARQCWREMLSFADDAIGAGSTDWEQARREMPQAM